MLQIWSRFHTHTHTQTHAEELKRVEGDSAGVPQDSFENYFRDMFLNVTHI